MGHSLSIAYLVLAYREPELLGQLTRWLSSGSADVFVHVDLNVDPEPFISAAHPSVKFLDKRFSCPWGTWGRVGASLAMLEAAVTAGASHVVLLSEDSFPLHDPCEIPELLAKDPTHIWIDAEPMGGSSKPLSRLSRKSFFRGDPRHQSLGIRVMKRLPFSYSRVDWQSALGSLEPWAGDSWFIFPRDVAMTVLEHVRSNPETMQFFSETWIPDEHFFQTVVVNSFPDAVLRGSPMFADWTSGKSAHPPFLLDVSSEADLLLAKESYLFARKLEKLAPEMTWTIEKAW